MKALSTSEEPSREVVVSDTPRSLTALLIEQSDSDALLFQRLLSSSDAAAPFSAVVEHVRTIAEARSSAGRVGYDLVVVDDRLGAEDGLDFVRELRSAGVETPILVLTGKDGEPGAIAALRAGASDSLAKANLSAEGLHRSVRYALDLARQTDLRRQAERALRVREAQLREAQRLETLATLTGGVGHEFNNLLNVIVGYGDMLRRRLPAGDPLLRYVEHISQAADKATTLTRQLMAFSRSQVMQPAVLDAGALLQELAPVVRSVVGRRVELVVQAEAGPLWIKADRSQFDHALMSVIVNARDAMPDGGKLTLEAAPVVVDEGGRAFGDDPLLRPGRYISVAISDTGHGMSDEVRRRALEPFFTTKGRAEATGLGLSTVYGIVRQSGGYLWLDSHVGNGTTIKIYMPQVDAAGKPLELLGSDAPTGNEVVLVVDDENALRELLAASIRGAGYAVLEAASGPEAIRLAETAKGAIQLLLSDVVMPGMNGGELFERLRETRPDLRVVFMSGATREALRDREDTARAPFLWKPFAVDELLRTIRRTLDGGEPPA
jgi:signal transduction histidine kinase